MIFKRKKEGGYVDLTSRLAKEEEKRKRLVSQDVHSEDLVDLTGNSLQSSTKDEGAAINESSAGFFGFFGGSSTAKETQSSSTHQGADEKKQKLIKRMMDLTNRLEEQEKEIYQMKQRIEVLERKSRIGY